MKSLLISIIESIYLIYMFLFLQTSIDFNSTAFDTKYSFLKHAEGNQKTNRICPFGHYAIFVLIAILLGRHLFPISKWFVIVSIGIALLISLMNMNALVYLLPIVVVEGMNY